MLCLSAEQSISLNWKSTVETLRSRKSSHIGAKLLDEEQSNIVNILKSKIEDLEEELKQYRWQDNIVDLTEYREKLRGRRIR